MRKLHTKHYKKQVPGHHIQVDVKFLTFKGKRGEKVLRFKFTAIDFIDHIVEKFSFRIREVRTYNGHEFQENSIGMLKILGSGTLT